MTQTLSPARDTGIEFRAVADDELRAANDVFLESLHMEPLTDEKWADASKAYEPGRTYGAFAGNTLIGSVTSISSDLTVPGGATPPMAAVTAVGVRTDHRRRGALTGMMRLQLTELARAGEVFAALHASEPAIYGRYGYGLGTRAKTMRVRTGRGRLRADVPTAGTVRLLTKDETTTLLPAAYPRLRPARVGVAGRSPRWWALRYEYRMAHAYLRVAAHFDRDGAVDGFVCYLPGPASPGDPRAGARITVVDFMAAGQEVENDLWRFLLGIDLVDELTVYMRPLDDPLDAMLVDLSAVRSEPEDELWLRLVDVPAALAARTYGSADPVVVEVVDPLLPNNSGRYRISPHGTERTDEPAGLTMGAETLGMIYLGTWRPSALAAIGRLTAPDPSALAAADRLFAADRPAWCGSMF